MHNSNDDMEALRRQRRHGEGSTTTTTERIRDSDDMAEAQRRSSLFAVSAEGEHSRFLLSSTLILNR